MPKKMIRVFIVEDSPVVTLILKRIFASSPEIEVVGTAQNGLEALEIIPNLKPDVICTDLHMAKMNGLEFTREVMSKYPRPILVISASVQPEDTYNVFQLLDAGAVDVFPKPRALSVQDYESLRQELISKIKILSGVAVFTLRRRHRGESSLNLFTNNPGGIHYSTNSIHKESQRNTVTPTPSKQTTQPFSRLMSHTSYPISHCQTKIVTIGASTGGPQALHTILANLPSNFGLPVICIQHISDGFLQGLVDWLATESKLPVKIAKMGDLPQAGIVYFPPEGQHLELNSQGKFLYSSSPPLSGHRPSVTVTFNSVAKFYGRSAVGILLTGMGRDGADGMLAIAQAGGVTIAQNEATSVVFGMPKEAIALGAAKYILPVNEICPFLLNKIVGLKDEV